MIQRLLFLFSFLPLVAQADLNQIPRQGYSDLVCEATVVLSGKERNIRLHIGPIDQSPVGATLYIEFTRGSFEMANHYQNTWMQVSAQSDQYGATQSYPEPRLGMGIGEHFDLVVAKSSSAKNFRSATLKVNKLSDGKNISAVCRVK